MQQQPSIACAFAGIALLVLSAAPSCAQQEFIDIDEDGATIGAFPGDVFVGRRTPVPITVYTDSGTSVGGTLETFNNTRLVMNDGFVEFYPLARDQSYIRVNNVLTGSGLTTLDQGRADIYGGIFGDGSFGDGLSAFEDSAINLHGGIVLGDVSAFDNSILTIDGGGILTDVHSRQNAVVNLSGGIVGGEFVAFDQSTINITGTNLALTFLDARFGGEEFTLTGKLLDGTLLNHPVFVFAGANINLTVVPEPGAVALLIGSCVTVGICTRRRRRMQN